MERSLTVTRQHSCDDLAHFCSLCFSLKRLWKPSRLRFLQQVRRPRANNNNKNTTTGEFSKLNAPNRVELEIGGTTRPLRRRKTMIWKSECWTRNAPVFNFSRSARELLDHFPVQEFSVTRRELTKVPDESQISVVSGARGGKKLHFLSFLQLVMCPSLIPPPRFERFCQVLNFPVYVLLP